MPRKNPVVAKLEARRAQVMAEIGKLNAELAWLDSVVTASKPVKPAATPEGLAPLPELRTVEGALAKAPECACNPNPGADL